MLHSNIYKKNQQVMLSNKKVELDVWCSIHQLSDWSHPFMETLQASGKRWDRKVVWSHSGGQPLKHLIHARLMDMGSILLQNIFSLHHIVRPWTSIT